MISTQLRQKREYINRNSGQGFTLIEVIIAGVILVSVMAAVAQMSVSSLASTENRETRDDLEAAVNNDIQLLQQADSYLTFESLQPSEQQSACQNPTSYLIPYLENKVPASELRPGIIRSITAGEGVTQDLVEVIYQFDGPENGVGTELRIIELNPNFSAQCYTTS